MDPSPTAWRPWRSTSTTRSMTSTAAGDRAGGSGTRGEFSHKRMARGAGSGRASRDLLAEFSPHHPRPQPLRSQPGAPVTPVIRRPRKEGSSLPRTRVFGDPLRPLGESGQSSPSAGSLAAQRPCPLPCTQTSSTVYISSRGKPRAPGISQAALPSGCFSLQPARDPRSGEDGPVPLCHYALSPAPWALGEDG